MKNSYTSNIQNPRAPLCDKSILLFDNDTIVVTIEKKTRYELKP